MSSISVCAIAISGFTSTAAGPIMGTRSAGVAASIAVLDRGGPPLLASDVPYHEGIAVAHLRPVGVTDDQGIYLYLPVLGEITGEHSPAVLMKWFFIGCFALLLLIYPFLFYELFGSAVVAIAAPILALLEFGFTEHADLYWILSWCMLLCIPGLVLAYHWWSTNRRWAAVVLLTALMLAASFSTSIRIHAGLPILLSALGIVLLAGASLRQVRHFWRFPRWWMRPVIAAVLLVAYLSISTFGFAAVRAYRNHVIHQPSFGSELPTQHSFWHPAYIGLGYLPNRYGIEYHDAVAIDAVERARPGTGYRTKQYEATLRHIYGQIARDDPGFVLRNFWSKTRKIVSDAASRFWPAFLLLPAAVLAGPRRRAMRVALLVAIPAAVLGGLPPVLTVPLIDYELAWLGTWGALFLLALAWLWVTARDAREAGWPADLALRRGRPDLASLRGLSGRLAAAPAAWAALGGAVLAAVLLFAARPADPPTSAALYASEHPTTVDPAVLDRPGLRSWQFDRTLPPGWVSLGGAFVQPDKAGLYIRSPMVRIGAQLAGPWVDLQAGSYELVTLGRSLAGGYQVGVRTSLGTVVAASGYSWQQSDVPAEAMKVSFVLGAPTRVRPIVSSWSSLPNASSWILFKMKLLSGDQG